MRIAATAALVLIASQARAGLFDHAHLAYSFDASAAVPDISIGGAYIDTEAQLLYLAGDTDIRQQSSIRVFSPDGTFVRELDLAGPSSVLVGLDGDPATGTLVTTEMVNAERPIIVHCVTTNGHVSHSLRLDDSTMPFDITYAAAIAVDQKTGNVWLADNHLNQIHELTADFDYVRSIDIQLPINNGILGMDIDPTTGNFLLAGRFNDTRIPHLDYELAEVDPEFSTILSRFSLFPDNDWYSITSVTIDKTHDMVYAASGSNDHVFAIAVPEPTALTLLLAAVASLVVAAAKKKGSWF